MNPADIERIPLETDIEAAAAWLDQPRAEPQFALASNRFHVKKAKAEQAKKRRGIKSLIKPENALCVLDHLPAEPNDRCHILLRGDFVLCDLIPLLVAKGGGVSQMHIATLGLSLANADTLAALVESGSVDSLTLVVSHYFQQVDKATVFLAVENRLKGRARMIVTRCHAKVICMATRSGRNYVIEGSANLRSSDNIEQILITDDAETRAFHVGWIEDLA